MNKFTNKQSHICLSAASKYFFRDFSHYKMWSKIYTSVIIIIYYLYYSQAAISRLVSQSVICSFSVRAN